MKPEMEQLVLDCQRKDAKAQKRLYDEFSPLMLGVCMRYTHSRDEAQDLLHDGFIRVFDSIGRLKNPMALEDWMYHIMVNLCVNYTNRRRELQYSDLAGMDGKEGAMLTDDPFNTDPFETSEVLSAIQALPDPYGMAFNLREVEGLEFAEIAGQLGVKESTVRSAVARARKMLRAALEPKLNPENKRTNK